MRDLRGLLIFAAVVVFVAAVLWLATRRGSEPALPAGEGEAPIRFQQTDVPLISKDLAVELQEVRGTIHPEYTSWSVKLTCGEPEGCSGELAVRVDYHSGADARRLVLVNRVNVASGGELRFNGLQDPPTPVSRVDRLTLEVRKRAPLDAPPAEVID